MLHGLDERRVAKAVLRPHALVCVMLWIDRVEQQDMQCPTALCNFFSQTQASDACVSKCGSLAISSCFSKRHTQRSALPAGPDIVQQLLAFIHEGGVLEGSTGVLANASVHCSANGLKVTSITQPRRTPLVK